MDDINNVVITGNLTKDAELFDMDNNRQVMSCNIAINRSYTTQNGDDKKSVCFVKTVTFGNNLNKLSPYLLKGRHVLVSGRLNMESWKDKDTGAPRNTISIITDNIQFLDNYNKDAGNSDTVNYHQQTQDKGISPQEISQDLEFDTL